ncbi:DsbA family protein [Gordonia hydrophobica]|uniref:Thioredoxin domain-containing protein n=1 Tax=Gordonia hydrophobica TaxID=40516 RepID=A0ABZ2UB08_9ACTN|nr:thioredoxin domain-containing protein [Gordonia hydrophobica]MBM7365425.1 protein-disulfide isomerase [Gordonia hydrophobica]
MSNTESRGPVWLVPSLVVIVAAALIGFVVVYNGDDDDAPTAQPSAGEVYPYDIGIERRDAADPLAFGKVDALVTMVAFSDYQCPYCAQWSRDALPAILERVDAGQLRLEMRDISVFGDASRRAAEAAYAAALQDRYLDYHGALFADGKKPSPDQLTDDALVATAATLDLDVERFRTDLQSPETKSAVDRSEQEAATVGAYSTPSFILGGQPIAGAGPPETYLDKLDAMLPVDGD